MPKEYTVLSEALIHHTLALFIGADLPREVTGLPSRADLARELARRKGLDGTLPLAEIAQRVSQSGNRWDFTDFIRNALDTTGKSPQSFHQRVVALVKEHQIETIITTAYDNLLELAFQQAGIGINRVLRGGDVSFINPDCPTLIKLYGNAGQPDTLVVTEDDHDGLWRDRDKEDLLHEVRTVLRRQTVLFLGYNLADPDFNLLWREVLDRAGSFARTAYAVWPGLPEGEMRMWRDRGIVIWETNPISNLNALSDVAQQRAQPIPASKDEDVLATIASSSRILSMEPEPGPPQSELPTIWRRLVVTNQAEGTIRGCSVKVVSIERLAQATDIVGQRLHGFEEGWLSWVPGQFEQTTLRPGESKTLDLVWKSPHEPWLRVAISMRLGITRRPDESTDFIKIPKSGKYLIRLRIEIGDLRSIRASYLLFWGGAHGNFHIEQAPFPARAYHEAAAIQELIKGTKQGSDAERKEVARALRSIGAVEAIPVLMKLMAYDPERSAETIPVRNAARDALIDLGQLYRTEIVQAMCKALHDNAQHRYIRRRAVDSLGHLKATEVLNDLMAVAEDPDTGIRCGVARALGRLGRQESLPTLRQLANDPVKDVRTRAREAVDAIARMIEDGKAPTSHSQANTKGNDEKAGPEPLYGTGHCWAVLVGVNEYEDKANYGRLHVCVKDVEAVRGQLIAGGFAPDRIRLLTDHTAEIPTRANILTALKAVADTTETDDVLLLYYSGHGDEDRSESYLVARDGRRLVLSDTAVAVSRVKEIMEEAPARAKVIVLDACHSGADIGGKGPRPMSAEFIRRVFEQAEGLAILASCTQGQLSYEWRAQERSVFTHFLLEALAGQADRDEKGFVTVQDTNRHVANGVKLWASQHNCSQTPTLEGKLAGDIVLTQYRRRTLPPAPSSNRFTPLSGRITDADRVFDRGRELGQALDFLRVGSSVALVGPAGIGKSSLLTLLAARVREELGAPWEAVYLDLQRLSNEEQFREALCGSLHVPSCRGLTLQKALEGRRVLLCVDEVEKLSWDDDGFTRSLRAELRGLAEGPDAPLKLALAARTFLDRLFPDSQEETSPLANICLQVDVGPWDEATVHDFLLDRLQGTGVGFTEAEIARLVIESGGYPMQLMRAAHRFYSERTGSVR